MTDRIELYNGYNIRAFESSPGKWTAEIRKVDGSPIQILLPELGYLNSRRGHAAVTRKRLAPIGAPANKLLCHKLNRVVLCLMGAVSIDSANAQQTTVTKAEATLSSKVRCEDFIKNSDGTWTSGPNTKIGANTFPNHTFDTNGVSIGGADLATVLNRKCGG